MIRALPWLAALLFGSCELPEHQPGDAGSGKVCFDDSECAPNACCGMGTAVVHKSDAPDCSTVKCSGMCPVNGIKCGCGVPVCRNQRCTSAVATTPGCWHHAPRSSREQSRDGAVAAP